MNADQDITGTFYVGRIDRDLQELAKEMRGQAKITAGILVNVEHQSKQLGKIEKALQNVADAEFSCLARINNEQTQKRISKIEGLIPLLKEEVSTVTRMEQLERQERKEKSDNSRIAEYVVKHWVQIIVAILMALLGTGNVIQWQQATNAPEPAPVQRGE